MTDRLKSEALVELSWPSVISRKENQQINRMSLHTVHNQSFDHCTGQTAPAVKRLSEDAPYLGRSTGASVVIRGGKKAIVKEQAPHVTL